MSEADDSGPQCPACGQPVPSGAEYCPYCANSLPFRALDDDSDESDEPEPTDSDDESEYQQVHWSDESDEWATPPSLLRPLDRAVDGFDLDPCSGAEDRTIADDVLDKDDDGLAHRWHGAVWCNPPYSDVADWLEKCRFEAESEVVETILVLVPARTSTQWFHRFAADATALCFIEGRLSFGDAENSAPFPSMLVAFGDVSPELLETLREQGVVFVDGERSRRTKQASLEALGGENA